MRPWQAALCGRSGRDCERSRSGAGCGEAGDAGQPRGAPWHRGRGTAPRCSLAPGTRDSPAVPAGTRDSPPRRRAGSVAAGAAASGHIFWGHSNPCVTRIPARHRALLDAGCTALSSRKAKPEPFCKTQAELSLWAGPGRWLHSHGAGLSPFVTLLYSPLLLKCLLTSKQEIAVCWMSVGFRKPPGNIPFSQSVVPAAACMCPGEGVEERSRPLRAAGRAEPGAGSANLPLLCSMLGCPQRHGPNVRLALQQGMILGLCQGNPDRRALAALSSARQTELCSSPGLWGGWVSRPVSLPKGQAELRAAGLGRDTELAPVLLSHRVWQRQAVLRAGRSRHRHPLCWNVPIWEHLIPKQGSFLGCSSSAGSSTSLTQFWNENKKQRKPSMNQLLFGFSFLWARWPKSFQLQESIN